VLSIHITALTSASVGDCGLNPAPDQKRWRMADFKTIPSNIYFLRVLSEGIEGYETEGLPFSSMTELWDEAMKSSGEILSEMRNTKPGMNWRMDVADSAGALIYRFSFNAESFGS
jgi:hypothetical protein